MMNNITSVYISFLYMMSNIIFVHTVATHGNTLQHTATHCNIAVSSLPNTTCDANRVHDPIHI